MSSLSPSPPTMGRVMTTRRTSNEEETPARAAPPPKRKGTRSVSSLSPSQLARKRANDREAQRAIRQRTKEHIERLESEVLSLKNTKHGPGQVQALMMKNRLLEEELRALKESVGYPPNQPYQAPVIYDGSLAGGLHNAVGAASPRTSPYPSHPNYDAMSDFPSPSFMTLNSAPPMYVAGSSVSSPESSNNQDDFQGYLSVASMTPSTMSAQHPTATVAAAAQLQFKPEFEDSADSEPLFNSNMSQTPYRQQQQQQHSQSQPQQQQSWPFSGYYNPPNPIQSTA